MVLVVFHSFNRPVTDPQKEIISIFSSTAALLNLK